MILARDKEITMSSQSKGNWSFAVRLLSSVAVVGRDNEPIYLRGSLSELLSAASFTETPPTFSSADNNGNVDGDDVKTSAAVESAAVTTDNEQTECSGSENDDSNNNSEEGRDSSTAEENNSATNNKPGLFGRIKGAVIRKDNIDDEDRQNNNGGNSDTDGINEEDDDDDPFGFFGSSSSSSSQFDIDTAKGVVSAPMSLTEQLVLHASLDRFEEKMAARSSNGGPARWRSVGAMGTNAMWMGMLCEVDERMTLYGYVSNTGIKFILLLEVIHMNEDGSRCNEGCPSSLYASSTVSSSSCREAELKSIFAQLHDLYVRYTMNPFTKLRGPIKSHVFDKGIGEIAKSFNSSAIEQATLSGEHHGEELAWM